MRGRPHSNDGQALIRRAHSQLSVTDRYRARNPESIKEKGARAHQRRKRVVNEAARALYRAATPPRIDNPSEEVLRNRASCRRYLEKIKADPARYAAHLKKKRASSDVARANYKKRKERQTLALAGRPKPDACEACGAAGVICIDHCHARVLFRGFICSSCNLILGHAKDNPTRLRALADYLERFNGD